MNDSLTLKWGHWVVRAEGRFDRQGRLTVYNLPAGDGGGAYEVAGINSRFHPDQAAGLAYMIREGRPDTAAIAARNYILQYTDPAKRVHKSEAVQIFYRDCYFNRGPRGAALILQRALATAGKRVAIDGSAGPKTLAAAAEVEPRELIFRLLLARQDHERSIGRDDTSPFWRGLVNRWISCAMLALDGDQESLIS